MLRSLNTGVSGIKQFQTELDTIGNNLANINTIGFKSGRVEFADTLNQTLRAGSPDTIGTSGTSSVQVGNGVNVAGVQNLFTQGAVNQTGVTTDLAISGEGFFVVKNPATGETFATRAGDFHVDTNGYLVTNDGFRVQGFSVPPTSDNTGTGNYVGTETVNDIMLDKGTIPAGLPTAGTTAINAAVKNVSIDTNGKIQILLSDGSQYTRGQVLLQSFSNPNALLKQGSNLYSNMTGAGPQAGLVGTTNNGIGGQPNSGGLGHIESGSLEISNVDISREFSNLITAQRALQANAKMITTSDDVLQQVINIVR